MHRNGLVMNLYRERIWLQRRAGKRSSYNASKEDASSVSSCRTNTFMTQGSSSVANIFVPYGAYQFIYVHVPGKK